MAYGLKASSCNPLKLAFHWCAAFLPARSHTDDIAFHGYYLVIDNDEWDSASEKEENTITCLNWDWNMVVSGLKMES